MAEPSLVKDPRPGRGHISQHDILAASLFVTSACALVMVDAVPSVPTAGLFVAMVVAGPWILRALYLIWPADLFEGSPAERAGSTLPLGIAVYALGVSFMFFLYNRAFGDLLYEARGLPLAVIHVLGTTLVIAAGPLLSRLNDAARRDLQRSNASWGAAAERLTPRACATLAVVLLSVSYLRICW